MHSRLDTTSILTKVAYGIVIFGMVGFLGTFLCAVWLSNAAPPFMEMPMAELGIVGVDHSGRIYCVSDSYARLQVFQNDGRFLWGRGIGVAKGYQLWLDESDRVHILSKYLGSERVIDSQGKLLRQYTVSDTAFDQTCKPTDDGYSENSALDKSGNRYTVVHPTIWPTVLKKSVSGRQSVVISPRIWLWPISGPLPAWLFIVAGTICLRMQEAIRRHRNPS